MRGNFVTHSPTAQKFVKRVGVPRVESEDPSPEEFTLEFLKSKTKAELQTYVEERGIEVEGTGSKGNVLKQDLIDALR